MKIFVAFVVVGLVAVVAADISDNHCYDCAKQTCNPKKDKLGGSCNVAESCSSRYGSINNLENKLQHYANSHFIRSFEYLLLSTNFANYEKNRAGFEKLFRDLSDNKWHESIELIKYITQRGGEMNFNVFSHEVLNDADKIKNYDLTELAALGKALDIEKNLTLEAFKIHEAAQRKDDKFHDPEISSYVEKEFLHKQRDIIRKLAGYSNELTALLHPVDSSLSLFLFDEYLQKQ